MRVEWQSPGEITEPIPVLDRASAVGSDFWIPSETVPGPFIALLEIAQN